MLCQRCKQNEATHHSRITLNGFSQETHLCASCAQQTQADAGQALPSLLSQLMGFGVGQPALRGVQRSACPQCGLTLAELKHSARCGCVRCYEHFQLEPSILRAYGRTGHTGRVPSSDSQASTEAGKKRRREQLQEEMKAAIAAQEFERAAELRDELKQLDEKGAAS